MVCSFYNNGVNRILIQTDSLEVIQMITSVYPNSILIRRIQRLLQDKDHCVLWHIPIETNDAVDRISKMVLVDLEGVQILAITHLKLIEILDGDK